MAKSHNYFVSGKSPEAVNYIKLYDFYNNNNCGTMVLLLLGLSLAVLRNPSLYVSIRPSISPSVAFRCRDHNRITDKMPLRLNLTFA